MSQAKVDRYKQEKYNRKHQQQKKNIKKYFTYAGITLVVIAFIVYLGYSIAVSTGLYEPPTEPVTMTQVEKESLRQTLIQQNDPNVKNVETTTAAEIQTVEATSEDDAKKEKKKDKEAVTKEAETTEAE